MLHFRSPPRIPIELMTTPAEATGSYSSGKAETTMAGSACSTAWLEILTELTAI